MEPLKVASFGGALLVLFGALTGPLHDLSDYYLFSAHMVQHMLLVFAMPPLLLYGTPGWMLRPLLRDAKLLELGRRLTRPTGLVRDLQRDPDRVAPAAALQSGHGPAPLPHRWGTS